MAIKLALAAALLAALVALATATAYTTTITTTLDEESIPRLQCMPLLQGRQFRACQRYLSQRRSPYEEEKEEVNPEQGSIQECCQQLRQVDRQGCGCEAIRKAVRQVQQGGSRQIGESQRVYQRAQDLPRSCNLSSQQCKYDVVFF